MQKDLDAAGTAVPVHILGVNQAGETAAYNDAGGICDGRDTPFLEEGASDGVWQAWKVKYRDVFVVDQNNELVTIFNLTEHDLSDPANFDALKTILVDAASAH